MAAVKNIPSSESGPGVTCITSKKEEYAISNNPTTRKFTLWRILPDGGYEKMQTAASPLTLYEKIPDFIGAGK